MVMIYVSLDLSLSHWRCRSHGKMVEVFLVLGMMLVLLVEVFVVLVEMLVLLVEVFVFVVLV